MKIRKKVKNGKVIVPKKIRTLLNLKTPGKVTFVITQGEVYLQSEQNTEEFFTISS